MSPEERKKVATAGGRAVSQNKAHMAKIGRISWEKNPRSKEFMSEIGRKGGQAGRGRRKKDEQEET